MADLFTYLDWRGDLTFSERALNPIDGVILARAAYFPYAKILTPGDMRGMRLADAARAFEALENLPQIVLRADDVRLIAALRCPAVSRCSFFPCSSPAGKSPGKRKPQAASCFSDWSEFEQV